MQCPSRRGAAGFPNRQPPPCRGHPRNFPCFANRQFLLPFCLAFTCCTVCCTLPPSAFPALPQTKSRVALWAALPACAHPPHPPGFSRAARRGGAAGRFWREVCIVWAHLDDRAPAEERASSFPAHNNHDAHARRQLSVRCGVQLPVFPRTLRVRRGGPRHRRLPAFCPPPRGVAVVNRTRAGSLRSFKVHAVNTESGKARRKESRHLRLSLRALTPRSVSWPV
jgi:hypothetical protein